MNNKNTYDASFKSIIRNKSLLTYILKNFIDEYRNLSVEEIEPLLNVNFMQDALGKEVFSLKSEYNDVEYGKIEMDQMIGVLLPDGSGQIGLLFDFEM